MENDILELDTQVPYRWIQCTHTHTQKGERAKVAYDADFLFSFVRETKPCA